MNRLFEDSFYGDWADGGDQGAFYPSADLHQDAEKYELTAELPGVKRENVTVECRDGELLISGSKDETTQVDGEGTDKKQGRERLHTSRRFGRFEQRLTLPDDANDEAIEAEFADGILTVRIPRDEDRKNSRVRRVEVKSLQASGDAKLKTETETGSGSDKSAGGQSELGKQSAG
jgi:HSP20 family protein